MSARGRIDVSAKLRPICRYQCNAGDSAANTAASTRLPLAAWYSPGPPEVSPVTGPRAWLKRRGTYTPDCGGRVPIPSVDSKDAKGMTRTTCHRKPAMCAESLRKTDASGPAHNAPCLAFSPASSVRKVFQCTCWGRRNSLLPRKGGVTYADWARLDRYPPITLSAASGVKFAVVLGLKPQDCALSAFLSPSRERCGRVRVCI